MDGHRLSELVDTIQNFKQTSEGVLLIWGSGAFCKTLRRLYNHKVYLDTTPMQAMLRLKRGEYLNIGTKKALPFKMMARRCYYVDFELAVKQRFDLIHNQQIEDYVIANDTQNMTLLPAQVLEQMFEKAMCYPLRCKPVYLEGVWGGYHIQRTRNLPKEMKNCAWVFDLIPMEVSIVFDFDGDKFEFPFYTLVQSQGPKLMGQESVDKFGYYFPVRFNYDDTYHANGNMSIQCHPGEHYIKENNGELGRQDESYYIVEAGQGAKTYLGFHTETDKDQFIADARRSEKEGTPVDYQKYVYAIDSKPGTQVMIPAGTIHASGRNQVILEIGSLTVGSYTYKMYDYLRKDFDGKPRPIHTYHGDKVLDSSRTKEWVNQNLVNGGSRVVRSGEGWEEFVVGEHDLLYFSLRNMRFIDRIEDNTNGSFHVLTLVDGEQALIRSKAHPEYSFVQNYLDIVAVPAAFGEYEIINLKPQTTIIEHKTMLKQER
jgi:mannose-6-phosphate isomerase class I